MLCAAANVMLENLLTGEPLSDDIPVERSPGYGADSHPPTAATGGDGVAVSENSAYSRPPDPQTAPGPQAPTAATGGDGVAELENQACSRPPDPQTAPGLQAPTATTVGGDGQEKKNEEREPDD